MSKRAIRKIACLFAAGLLLAAGTPLHADDDDRRDQEMARRALQEGLIRPLSEISASLSAQFPGDIIAVELEVDDGKFIYEFKVLTPQGVLKEVEVDAKTAKVLKIEDDD